MDQFSQNSGDAFSANAATPEIYSGRASEVVGKEIHKVNLMGFAIEMSACKYRIAYEVTEETLYRKEKKYEKVVYFQVNNHFPESSNPARHMKPIWVRFRTDKDFSNDKIRNTCNSVVNIVLNEKPVQDGGNPFNCFNIEGTIIDGYVPADESWDNAKDNYAEMNVNPSEFNKFQEHQLSKGKLCKSHVIKVARDGLVPIIALQNFKKQDLSFLDFATVTGSDDTAMSYPPLVNQYVGMMNVGFDTKFDDINSNVGISFTNPNNDKRKEVLYGRGLVFQDGRDQQGTEVIFEYNDNLSVKQREARMSPAQLEGTEEAPRSRTRGLYETANKKPINLMVFGNLRINDNKSSDPKLMVKFRVSCAHQFTINSTTVAAESTADTGTTMSDWLNSETVINNDDQTSNEPEVPEVNAESSPLQEETDMTAGLDDDLPVGEGDLKLEDDDSQQTA